MALTRTLAVLREEVGYAADVTIGDARYPNALVDRWINDAIQAYAVLKRNLGFDDSKRSTLTGSASTSAGADGFPLNEVVSLPTDFGSVTSVYVNDSGRRWQLTALAESDRATVGFLSTSGPPESYTVIDATPTSAAKLRVWPPSNAAYSYELTYAPEPTVLVAVGDTWEYAPGTSDLVVCDVAKKILGRDRVDEPETYRVVSERYDRAMQALQLASSNGRGVRSMRDTQYLSSMAYRRRLGGLG